VTGVGVEWQQVNRTVKKQSPTIRAAHIEEEGHLSALDGLVATRR
jgi:hypothetical protein